jgi:hypothetical protein
LRTVDGTYLSRGHGDGDRLRADATARGERARFVTADPYAEADPSRLQG